MKKDDAVILREIQKNSQMGIQAIETIIPMVEDEPLALQLNRQELHYSRIRDQAREELLKEQEEGYLSNGFSELMLKGGIRVNTLFDTSTSHIAGVMIRESSRGMTDMWRALNHHDSAGAGSTELAEELIRIEQESMTELKKYL